MQDTLSAEIWFKTLKAIAKLAFGPISGTGLKKLHEEYDLSEDKNSMDPLAINEVQLILAEKRTSLAVLRTGIAVLALPSSVISILIATSKFYDVLHVLHFLIPLTALNLILIVFGAYLVIRSIIRMRHYDRFIHEIKQKYSIIGQFIE